MKIELNPRVPVDSLTHELLFEFPDIPDEVAENLIVRAAIYMATSGNVLRRSARICIQPCVSNYPLHEEESTRLAAIMSVEHTSCNGLNYEVRRYTTDPGARCICGHVATWYSNNEIWFRPANCGDIFDVQYSVSPIIGVCELDAAFGGELYEALILKAKSLALVMPQKAWTNVNLGFRLGADAQFQLSNLAVDVLSGHQRGLINVKRPRAV